jgi:putative ABC transport system permease protein
MDPQVRFSEDMMSLPSTTAQRVRGVEGVEWAAPMYKGFLRCQLADGSRSSMIVVGIDDATLSGAPHTINDGTAALLRQDPGILIDERDCATKLAGRWSKAPMKIGDRVSINDNDAVVVGTYKGTASFFWDPVVYTTYSRAIRFAPKERNLRTVSESFWSVPETGYPCVKKTSAIPLMPMPPIPTKWSAVFAGS